MACEECYLQDCDCNAPDEDYDSFCEGGCGADLDETDGHTIEVETGLVLQLCPECATDHAAAGRD